MDGREITWTVPEQDAALITAGVFTSNYNTFGTNLPTGIFGPNPTPRPGQGFLNRGNAQFSSPTPFPPGTTLFFQDVDSSETAAYRFYDCSGNMVDAGDFDFLKISSINTPSHTTLGTTPNRYWNIVATVAGNDPNTVNGISIRSSSVCQIDIQGTRPVTRGSINYFLGVTPNVVPTVTPAISGTTQVGSAITGTYTYADNESDIENPAGTTYKLVNSSSATMINSSEGTTVASGSTGGASGSVPYTLQPTDVGMYVYYCVIPAAQTGASPGVEVCTVASEPVTDKPLPQTPPVINDASYTTPVNTPVNGNAGTGGQVAFQTVTPPAHGQLTIDPMTGAFTYTPSASYTGTDTATVQVCLPAPNTTVCDDAVLTFNVLGGGSGSTATPVPTLGDWALIGLTSLVAMVGIGRIRRRQI
ncbi:IPTL-CTERM sorting domain-containing protein [Comamonas sp. 4034]|uniref:IPTL-CTERM sorting domain-containing protein n=1 Tax=Comamonas sp. 4034 TaxID=3156455 RepID=UPI003D250100